MGRRVNTGRRTKRHKNKQNLALCVCSVCGTLRERTHPPSKGGTARTHTPTKYSYTSCQRRTSHVDRRTRASATATHQREVPSRLRTLTSCHLPDVGAPTPSKVMNAPTPHHRPRAHPTPPHTTACGDITDRGEQSLW